MPLAQPASPSVSSNTHGSAEHVPTEAELVRAFRAAPIGSRVT